jgi:chemotaxis protein methyltransferase CheR
MTDRENLMEIARLIREESGIAIQDSQLASLVLATERVAPDAELDGFLAQLQGPNGHALLAHLIDEITVQETYFFRQPEEFEKIDWHDLLRRAHQSGAEEIRIWVPACATGEEPYTLALLAMESLGHGRTPVSIVATDISTVAINAAIEGSYSPRSMRFVPADLVERHFIRSGRYHRVGSQLRSLVRFRRHNLIAESIPPPGETPFELIACRNVLIYLDAETIEPTVQSMESALAPGGRLILGAADRLTRTAARLNGEVAIAPAALADAPVLRELRRPLGVDQAEGGALADALKAADEGNLDLAIDIASGVLERDPLDADALFVRGLAELGRGDSAAGVVSLRRALYVDPSFGLAAFQLGRAHDAAGNEAAARQAYERALWAIDADDERHSALLDQVDLGDIASACRVRLASSNGVAVAR